MQARAVVNLKILCILSARFTPRGSSNQLDQESAGRAGQGLLAIVRERRQHYAAQINAFAVDRLDKRGAGGVAPVPRMQDKANSGRGYADIAVGGREGNIEHDD